MEVMQDNVFGIGFQMCKCFVLDCILVIVCLLVQGDFGILVYELVKEEISFCVYCDGVIVLEWLGLAVYVYFCRYVVVIKCCQEINCMGIECVFMLVGWDDVCVQIIVQIFY